MGIRFRSIRTAGLLVATCAAGLLTANCTGALGAVDAPALIVHGAGDSLGLAGSRAWADAFPRGELFVVSGAHRGAIADRPDLVEPAITSFIQEGRMPHPPPSGLMSPLSANHRPIEP